MKKILLAVFVVLVAAAVCQAQYYGSRKIDDTLTFTAPSHDPSTGAVTDADAVPAYRIYEDEVGTAILTGNMAKLDDANTTGFYSEQITLSAANGFEKGKTYNVLITGAVGGTTGAMTHNFQIEAEVDANTVSGTVTLANGAHGGAAATFTLSDYSDFKATGFSTHSAADVKTAMEANGTSILDELDDRLIGTIAAGTHNPQSGDAYGIVNNGTYGNVALENLVDDIGAAGAGLTNIDLPNQTMDIIGSLSGAVGSVTGAVGSVTGAVGSVTGAVGSVTDGVTLAADAITEAKIADNAFGIEHFQDDIYGYNLFESVGIVVAKEIGPNTRTVDGANFDLLYYAPDDPTKVGVPVINMQDVNNVGVRTGTITITAPF